MSVYCQVPPHAGNVIGGEAHVRGATRAKAAQSRMALKPERVARLKLFTKVFYVLVPGHGSRPLF